MQFGLGKRLGQEVVCADFQCRILCFQVDACDHNDFYSRVVFFEKTDKVYAEAVREPVV